MRVTKSMLIPLAIGSPRRENINGSIMGLV
jgi:hypothetical protein